MKKQNRSFPLVFVGKGDEVYTSSDIIAKHAQVQHHTVTRLIRSNKSDFEEFGKVGFEIQPLPESKTGQRVTIYHLNEQQATLLMTYLRNNETVRGFKKELVRQFYAMREILWKQRVERQTDTWQTARIEGKKTRCLETDEIRLFVEYAEASGSKNAGQYYRSFTNLAHTAVGITSGTRDSSTTAQLLDLRTVERVIGKAIVHEIGNRTEYHQAFQNVKVKVLQVAALALDSGLELPA